MNDTNDQVLQDIFHFKNASVNLMADEEKDRYLKLNGIEMEENKTTIEQRREMLRMMGVKV